MDNLTDISESTDNKNFSKFAFMRKKGFKRGACLLIILTFLSIIYTFVNKLSSPNINQIYQDVFARMKEEITKSPMMKNIMKIANNFTGIENLSFK